MKKHILFTTMLSLFVLAVSASAQSATNYAGTWTLDIAKSRISDREKAAIEFQSLTVVQSEKEVMVTTSTKRVAPPGAQTAAGPMSMWARDPGSLAHTCVHPIRYRRPRHAIPVALGQAERLAG